MTDLPTTQDQPFLWRDGQGLPWTVTADRAAITLDDGTQQHVLEAAGWPANVEISPLTASCVVRFELGDRQVGFLLQPDEAIRFLEATGLGIEPEKPETPAPAPVEQPPPRVRLEEQRVQPASVIAMLVGVVSFLPFVGFALAPTAILLAVAARDRMRHLPYARDHDRVLTTVAIGLALWGLLVCTGSLLAYMQPRHAKTSGVQTVQAAIAQAAEADEKPQGVDYGMIVVGLLVILLSLSLHEAAHGIAAWWCGDQTARLLGRVTLNPIAHIDLFGTIILPLLLVWMQAHILFGWARPVPVDRRQLRHRRTGDILVSFAGPLSNLIQAAVLLSMLTATVCTTRLLFPESSIELLTGDWYRGTASGMPGAPFVGTLVSFCTLGVFINVLLAVFNMIPLPPLDGSWIAAAMSPRSVGAMMDAIRPYSFLILLGLVYTNVLGYILIPAMLAARDVVQLAVVSAGL